MPQISFWSRRPKFKMLLEKVVYLIQKGNNFLRYGCRELTRFDGFQDRIMKLSGIRYV